MTHHLKQQGFSVVEALLILVIISLLGGSGYYVLNAKNNAGKSLDSAASQEQKIPTLNQAEKDDSVISFASGAFTNQDKKDLSQKLIEPYFAYYNQFKGTDKYVEPVSITIHKISDEEYAKQQSYAKYRFKVEIVTRNSGTESFIYGDNDKIDYWLPNCGVIGCTFDKEFRAKYPQIVTKVENS